MALIKCPECGKEISSTADVCVNCGYPIKNKRNLNIKLIIPIMVCIVLALIAVIVVNFFKRTMYPEMMKVLSCSSVSDAKELLGNNYETMLSSTSKFYVYNNLELDGVVYDTIHITEKSDGSLYEIGFEFYIDDLNVVEKYVKDISRIYGECIKKTDSYYWKTSKSINPKIYIYGKESPYKIYINLN